MRIKQVDVLQYRVQPQEDDWSCGHRIVLIARALLKSGLGLLDASGRWVLKIEDVPLHHLAYSTRALEDLCGVKSVVKPSSKFFQSKKEPHPCGILEQQRTLKIEGPAASAAKVDAPNAVPKKELPAERPAAEPAQQVSSPSSADVSKVKVKMEKPDLQQGPAVQQRKAREQSLEEALEEEMTLQGLAGVASEGEDFPNAKERKRIQIKLRKCQKQAKEILAQCGLTFNHHFQKRHSERVPKGHWQGFLASVCKIAEQKGLNQDDEGGGLDMECETCRGLLKDFNVQDFVAKLEEKKRSTKSWHIPDSDDDQDGPGQDDAGAPHDVPDDGPPQKKRRGRPAKGSEPTFNILDFLEEHRSGQYKILTKDEVLVV